MAREKRQNDSRSLGRVKFATDKNGNLTGGWSQLMRNVGPEKSPNWDKRQNAGFAYNDVYPCNEGFPQITHVGPVDGGWPTVFDLVLADGQKGHAIVSAKEVDGLPSWAMMDPKSRKVTQVSYYDVAGWSTPKPDYDRFEKVVAWIIKKLSGR